MTGTYSPNPHLLGTISDFSSNKFFEKSFLFELMSPNLLSSYQDAKTKQPTKAFPASYALKLEVEVFDREANPPRRRIMRLVKGETSIWADEQSKDEKVPKAVTYLDFIDGKRLIAGDDTLMLKFLMKDPRNSSNPERDKKVNAQFKLVDMAKGLEEEIQKDMRLTEIKQWCYTGPWHEVAAYARVLNRPTDRDPSQVRADMVRHAIADPERFYSGMKNPLALRKHYVITAMEMDVLELDPHSNSIMWKGSGTRLITAPLGAPAIDFFVDYSQTPEGEESYNHMLKKMNLDPEVNKVKVSSTPAPSEAPVQIDPTLNASSVTPAEATALLAKAIEKGVIYKYGTSTYAFDYKGPDERKFTGPKAVTTAMVTEVDFLRRVQAKLKA